MTRFLVPLILAGALASLPARAASPGGRFDDRLRQAEQRYGSAKAPARASTPRGRVKPVSPARTSTPRTASTNRATTPSRRSVRAAAVRPVPPRRVRQAAARPYSRVAGSRIETREIRRTGHRETRVVEEKEDPVAVTYSIDPRADRASSSLTTGDLVLFTQPAGTPVYYEWDGGARRSSRTTVIKGLLPGTIQVRAYLPNGTRGDAWVNVKAGCITTVRFAFPGR